MSVGIYAFVVPKHYDFATRRVKSMKTGLRNETLFHKNGQLQLRGQRRDGIPVGLYEWFDEDGNRIWTETYEFGDAVLPGTNPTKLQELVSDGI